MYLESPVKKLNIKAGKTHTVRAKAKLSYRLDNRERIDTVLYVKDNMGAVRVEGNTIQAIAPGNAQVFVKHTFEMLGEECSLVSEPIEVTVK